ncbi:MAG: beta-lactamase family protein [Pleurocapsa minor GSE-CHR-MK-17-07R]|nr:beta-lactamase family protein [Pleurocapsa minor GSE-CHR-MK 17-07R]
MPRATPESQGVASSAILQFVETVERQKQELHSFMLLRHGQVVAEGWWSPYGPEHPHLMFSLSKSFTSTAVGMAVAEGYFSIDDPVLSFFPDETVAAGNDLLATMCVRHLLSMSTGQAVDSWSSMVGRPDGNWIAGFLEVPVVHAPGSHFVYNTGATYMLSAIVQKTTGMKLVDFLQARLFAPLGIEGASWQESPQGITAGGIGLSIKTEDIARFGQFYLQKGNWQGSQLLPEAWVEEATSARISNSDGVQPDWSQGYGYQFWRCRHDAYRGDGVFGQYCIVMPRQDAVLAITSGLDVFDMQGPLNLVWDILLPAMQPDALPDDAAAQAALAGKLSGLSLKPVQGRASSPIAAQISGRTYAVDANALGIDRIAFDFSGADCTLSVRTGTGDETIPCGYGTWQRGQPTALFGQPLLFGRTPVMTSGAWTAEDVFTMVVRLVETPFYHTAVCHFAGDGILIDIRINVSLESMEPVLLLAYPA